MHSGVPDETVMTTTILNGSEEDLGTAADALRRGELVAIPTETVYGLAAKGLDGEAVAKIFEVKERPLFDPLILHLPPSWRSDLFDRGLIDLKALSEQGRDQVTTLTRALWPGPLTIVVPKTPAVPDITTSGLPTVAVRIPNHPLTRRLLDMVEFPLAAPSANRFGRISPTSVDDVIEELGGRIGWIVDGGTCEIGLESTVVRIVGDGTVQLLRPGKVRRSEIEHLLGVSVGELGGDREEGAAEHSPGRLETHYAPSSPLVLLEGVASEALETIHAESSPAMLFRSDATMASFLESSGTETLEESSLVAWRVLSPAGEPASSARNLFRMLRELDSMNPGVIFAEPPEGDAGISHAIRDRLERASRR